MISLVPCCDSAEIIKDLNPIDLFIWKYALHIFILNEKSNCYLKKVLYMCIDNYNFFYSNNIC